jgi:hypothetical protein
LLLPKKLNTMIILIRIRLQLLIASVFCFSLASAQINTVETIKKEYASIFITKVFHHEDQTFVATTINTLPKNHPLADFVNNNSLYLDYLLSNYAKLDRDTFIVLAKDTVVLQNYFVNTLKSDTIFTNYFLEAVNCYLNSVGKKIKNYKPQAKLKLTTDSIVTIASRFFYANALNEKGGAKWNICVGKNGYHNNKKNLMAPLVEAFCFMAIMNDVSAEEFKILPEFKTSIKKVQNTATDKVGNDKLEFYRESMYFEMKQNEKLKNLLLEKYKVKKSMLNFEITDVK